MKSCYQCEKQVVCKAWGKVEDEAFQYQFLAAPKAADYEALAQLFAKLCLQYKKGSIASGS